MFSATFGRTTTSKWRSNVRAKIRKVAIEVRAWAERQQELNLDFSDDLCGMCAIASAELFLALRRAGISSRIALAWGHCFVISHGYIVDVTATQFRGGKRIEIQKMAKNENDRPWYWRHFTTFRSVKKLTRHQITQGWPDYQTAGYLRRRT